MENFEKLNDFSFMAFMKSIEEIGIMGKNVHIKTNKQEYFSLISYFCFTSKCLYKHKKIGNLFRL